MVKMGSASEVRELQRTGRDSGGRGKPHPPGQKPEGGRGMSPLRLGGAGPTRARVGRKQRGATGWGEEGGRPGLGIRRTLEADEGSSARSSRVGTGAG